MPKIEISGSGNLSTFTEKCGDKYQKNQRRVESGCLRGEMNEDKRPLGFVHILEDDLAFNCMCV